MNEFCDKIKDQILQNWPYDIDFLGFSIGCSSFLKDGNEWNTLMSLADFSMFQEKKMKHK